MPSWLVKGNFPFFVLFPQRTEQLSKLLHEKYREILIISRLSFLLRGLIRLFKYLVFSSFMLAVSKQNSCRRDHTSM